MRCLDVRGYMRYQKVRQKFENERNDQERKDAILEKVD